MSFNLSEGAIEAIITGNRYDSPVFQMISSRVINTGIGGSDRYRILLSDGRHTYSNVMLAIQLNPMILTGEMDNHCLIRCKQYHCKTLQGDRTALILVEVEVLANGWYMESRIGNPQPYRQGPVPAQPVPGCRISNPQPFMRDPVPDKVHAQLAPGVRIDNPQSVIRGPVSDEVPAKLSPGGRIDNPQSFPLVSNQAPAQPAPNISTAINTCLMVQDESPVTMAQVRKCRDFLGSVIKICAHLTGNNVIIVTALIQGLIDGKLEPQKFVEMLQNVHRKLKSIPQPNLINFLKNNLQLLREELFNNRMVIPGIVRPPLHMVHRDPVLPHTDQVPHTTTDSQNYKQTTSCTSSATSSTSSPTSCTSSSAGTTDISILAGSSLITPWKEEKTAELKMNISMPAVSSHNLHEHLMCAICLDLYTDPVRLTCMHCFCRKCITDHTVKGVNSIPSCPECNSTILTKEIGSLKTDFKLKELVSAIRDKPLCSDHDAQDERIAELICKTCHVTLCTKCAFAGQHVAHVLDDLQTAVHKYYSEMSTKMPNIKEKLDGYCTQITEVRHYGTELQDIQDSTETEFNRLIEDLLDKVRKVQAEGLEEISDSFFIVKEELGKREATLATNIRNGENFMKWHSSLNTDPANSIKSMANADGYLENDPVDIEEPDRAAILDNCPSLATHLRQLKHMVESCQQFMQPSHGGANTGKFPAKRKTDAASATRTFQVPGKRVKLDVTNGTEELPENGVDHLPSGQFDHKGNGPVSWEQSWPSGSGGHKWNGPVSGEQSRPSGSGGHKGNGPVSGEQSRPSGSGDHKENGPFSWELSQEGINSGDKSPPPSVVKLTARIMRVGTYRLAPIGPIIISEKGLSVCIEGVFDNLYVNIWPHEIKQCLIGDFPNRDITLIFLLTTHSCGELMRRELGMRTHLDPSKPPPELYFDPSHPEMRYNMITIVIDELPMQNRVEFLKYMELIKLRCKQGDDRFIIELSTDEALKMLRQSVCDSSSIVATSKASDEDQQ